MINPRLLDFDDVNSNTSSLPVVEDAMPPALPPAMPPAMSPAISPAISPAMSHLSTCFTSLHSLLALPLSVLLTICAGVVVSGNDVVSVLTVVLVLQTTDE